MLHIRLGRDGMGVSQAILQEMGEKQGGRRQLLIVPDQASHETERRLCAVAGNGVSRYAEVLTFTRLASRVFAITGGLATPTLDAGGRVLLMASALKLVGDQLKTYAKPSKKPAFLSGLLATLDECKQYQISPGQLAQTGQELEGPEGEKMADLGLIFGAYNALCARTAADPRDRMTRLAQALPESQFARDMDVYVDGFTDFTPQQGQILQALLTQAHTLTVAVNAPELRGEGEMGIFAPAHRTAAFLMYLAKECRQEIQVEETALVPSAKAPALAVLETQLFADQPQPWPEEAPQVVCCGALTPRTEVEETASEILRLVREEGYHFRDIAVVARGFDGYRLLVEEVFRQYDIPVFLDSMTDILQKPVFAVVAAALDAVAGHYSYEDMFRYLKTGLGGITRAECDLLENYVLKWGIRGSRWTAQTDWTMHPRGFGQALEEADTALLVHINEIRCKVISPLEKLRQNANCTGYGQGIALYEFLEEIHLAETLSQRAERLQERGELKAAQEDRQLWDILCGGLEQCVQILDEAPMELEEFVQLFKLVLSQYEVGTIPVSLDRVSAGDAARLGNREIQGLFFLGADDSAIPQVASAPGLFTDDDRSLLASYGLELAPMLADKLDREMTILYVACTRPSRHLAVSWAMTGASGEERQPSLLLGRLAKVYPENTLVYQSNTDKSHRLAAANPALSLANQNPQVKAVFQALPDYAPLIGRMEGAAQAQRGSLSPAVTQQLYGTRVPMSASRMDKYKSCHFAYFMQYGLGAKPRQSAGFEAPEYGTFVHYVLERILKQREQLNTDGVLDRDKLSLAISAIFDSYIQTQLGGLEDKTPRFVYLFQRLLRPVTQVAKNVLEELSCGDFQPIAFELGFGRGGDLPPVELTVDGVTVSLSGFVDRVDGWVRDGKLYLRIIDYKTGRKSFDFTEVWNGLGLQTLLYLFTLEEKGAERFDYQVTPAGVLYLPAREAVVQGSHTMSEAEREKLVNKELQRKGLILEDPAVLEAMEHGAGGSPKFLPIKVSAKTGAISGDALVSAARLGRLKHHTQKILEEIGRELASGTIAADPFWRSPEKHACQYCDYVSACHFEAGRDAKRYLPTLEGAAFWSAVDPEIEEGGEEDGISPDGPTA